MPKSIGKPSEETEPLPKNDPIESLTKHGDPALRHFAWLVLNRDLHLLEQRFGFRKSAEVEQAGHGRAPKKLPILLQFAKSASSVGITDDECKALGISLASLGSKNSNKDRKSASAKAPLEDEIFDGKVAKFLAWIESVLKKYEVRLGIGVPGQPCREGSSLCHIGLPADRTYKGVKLTGDGVVVGIIDDGCAFAHPHFLKPREKGKPPESRILNLWDQGEGGQIANGWKRPADFDGVGRELDKVAIDDALKMSKHCDGELVREDRVYEYFDYKIDAVGSHGTHVMDTAAGNGRSLMGSEGVAPGADIIFVQLPKSAIEGGARALVPSILDGIDYILARADGKPAVINISYGGYDGPHDGSSILERAIDETLAVPDRAAVISAGNGFEADCHAQKTVATGTMETLRWIVRPEDSTTNDLELWYPATDEVQVRLRSPGDVTTPSGWIPLNYPRSQICRTGSPQKIVGQIEHLPGGTGNNANRVVINLRPTDTAAEDANNAPAPSGVWLVEIRNQSHTDVEVHGWIWRDDSGRPKEARRRQSRFHPDDASPKHSISGWATGSLALSVGAFNVATGEVCRYSACGPALPNPAGPRPAKPDVLAPAEEDVRGRGVLSGSSLSARPTRMNGTSASAPHVAGLIALMFEFQRKFVGTSPLPKLRAEEIGNALRVGARRASLCQNRHQIADERVKVKQKDVWGDVVGSGQVNFLESMTRLFP